MRQTTLTAVCLALILTACRHVTPEPHTHAGSSPLPSKTTPELHARSVMELTGGHDAVCGRWRVVVSGEDASLHISRLSGTGSTTISPQGWKAAKGAFLFVEGDERVWAYDGSSHDLLMVAAQTNTMSIYGLRQIPCDVPDEVSSRLPVDLRQRTRDR